MGESGELDEVEDGVWACPGVKHRGLICLPLASSGSSDGADGVAVEGSLEAGKLVVLRRGRWTIVLGVGLDGGRW